ncbi:hypothetical protein BGX27_007501 [Mortierella sp. AM989]|nr:hypothetical protein BGX27_007501 [Mortierella sp. AM989]
MTFKQSHLQLKGASSERKPPLLPLQRPSPSRSHYTSALSCKKTVFFFIAISSAVVLLNTARFQLSTTSNSVTESNSSETAPLSTAPIHDYDYGGGHLEGEHEQRFPFPYHEPEDVEPENAEDEDKYRFSDEDNSFEDEDDGDIENLLTDSPTDQQRRQPIRTPHSKIEGVIPPQCPSLFLSTETSFSAPSFTSSSTAPTNNLLVLSPDQVNCKSIPSQLEGYSLAFCISNEDCSRGFIQIVRQNGALDPALRVKVSKEISHDQHFRQVTGPDDFYFVIEGAQKLALGAHLVSRDLLVDVDGGSSSSENLVYRADFRMTLPGPVQLSGWLAYEKFRAVRENRPGVWPQWTHSLLIDPETVIDPTQADSYSTKFDICSNCELDSFLEQVKNYREEHFEQCDRRAPVRGSYWKEELALKVYSDMDTINKGPGAGTFFKGDKTHDQYADKSIKDDQDSTTEGPKLTRGWRFVPNGCTMTKTSNLPNASSRDPYSATCDSIASPGAAMLKNSETTSDGENDFPRRRILFTGDSQVRTTYNAILNHYRPWDHINQRFAFHDEYIPGREVLDLNNTVSSKSSSATIIPHTKSDTEIELIYKADQFLDFLTEASDKELDRYDTIYINIGQWPASGPVAGGQWSTAKLIERWEAVIVRLNRWRQSREEQLKARPSYSSEADAKRNPTVGTGDSSIVIWAGMNAFPMRKDPSIKVKGDWRTNARLGYWDDWIETISQEAGGWFRRMNSWQLTFPMLNQVTDKAHFQETDAIDALKIEALYKLDLCSRMQPDTPYPNRLAEATTTTTTSA